MTIGSTVVLVAIGLGFIAFGRRSQDRFWWLLGALVLIAPTIVVVRDGIDARLVHGPNHALGLAGGAILAVYLIAEGVGLPRSIASRIGLGLSSREWEFDLRLTDEHSGFSDLAREVLGPQSRADRASFDAKGRLARMRRLRAPNPDWAALRDELAALDSRSLDLLIQGEEPQEVADLPVAYRPTFERWRALRERYRAEAEGMQPNRLGRIVRRVGWPVAFSACALLNGLAILRVIGGQPATVDQPEFWLGVACLGLGLLALLTIWPPLGNRLFR
jgi:hypothetical protein